MQRPGSCVRFAISASLAALAAGAPALAQNGRVLTTAQPPHVGGTATFEVTVPPAYAVNANILGWWVLTDHSPLAVPAPLPFVTQGLYRGGPTRLGTVGWSAGAAPNVARLDLPIPPIAGLAGFAFDLLTLDLTMDPVLGRVATWSDNDLELTVGDLGGCGSAWTPAPLFPPGTQLEPDIVTSSPTALTTRVADRARRRHARDNQAGLGPALSSNMSPSNPTGLTILPVSPGYDEWKDHYWEQRTMLLEIEDEVAMGGAQVTFRWKTFARLAPAEFRFFYRRESEPTNGSTYRSNRSDYLSALVTNLSGAAGAPSSDPNAHPNVQREWVYETVVTDYEGYNVNRPLQLGDVIEFEPSQFMNPTVTGGLWTTHLQNGTQSNYYGTAFVYVVGQGLRPWYAAEVETGTPGPDGRISYDSYPLPDAGRLAGDMTLHYSYSGERTYRYKQVTSNLSHQSSDSFLQGRRLHHTDFGTGAHSEPNNPVLQAHVGQLGPQFAGRSCVACHVSNGRSLLPAVGQELDGFALSVGADAAGAPHPLLGDTLQPRSTDDPEQWQVEVEAGVVVGAAVQASTDPSEPSAAGQDVVYSASGQYSLHGGFTFPHVAGAADYVVDVRYESAAGAELKFEQQGGGPGSLYQQLVLPPSQGWATATFTVSLPSSILLALAYDAASAGPVRVNWVRIREQSGPNATPGEGAVSLAAWIPHDDGFNAYADGTTYQLRRPQLSFDGAAPSFYSLRAAQPLIGLGLLEAVDEATLLALADPCDDDDDGISGRVARVTDLVTGQPRVGRFTWKGSAATIADQVAHALNRHMGVATARMATLDGEATPSPVEVSDEEVARMARYVGLLGVNARRDLHDPEALQGEQLFDAVGCAACHVRELTTGHTHPWAEVRDQTIRPFTDLLLHDMGPGLADNMRVPSSSATAAEWRTPPLWGIGLSEDVSGGPGYLHDGRALSLEEAILWHGGEGEASKQAFRALQASERAALVAFLRSL